MYFESPDNMFHYISFSPRRTNERKHPCSSFYPPHSVWTAGLIVFAQSVPNRFGFLFPIPGDMLFILEFGSTPRLNGITKLAKILKIGLYKTQKFRQFPWNGSMFHYSVTYTSCEIENVRQIWCSKDVRGWNKPHTCIFWPRAHSLEKNVFILVTGMWSLPCSHCMEAQQYNGIQTLIVFQAAKFMKEIPVERS